jgi:hypothetical protein
VLADKQDMTTEQLRELARSRRSLVARQWPIFHPTYSDMDRAFSGSRVGITRVHWRLAMTGYMRERSGGWELRVYAGRTQ